MLETYFPASKMLGHLRSGPSGRYLDGFAAVLERQGYSAGTAVRYLRAAAHLGHVVARQGAVSSDIDLAVFSEHLRTCRCPRAMGGRRNHHKHDIAVLAALGLLDANDLLRAVDMLDLEPDHLAGAQPAAIAETEQCASLEAAGDGQQAPRLVLAHHQRDLLRLADVIDLGGKIQSPQRHAEQEPQPGHDAVAIADAHARLGQLQLEAADVLECGCVGGPLHKRREPLAAADMASLRARNELSRIHVLDHALAPRADSIRTHSKLLYLMWLPEH